ncbi:MAG: DUF2845 domain-containing protein [Legionellales bacterium]|nr:DUF2845 domain-containing protein [Legionellales bacterium]
MFKQLCSLTMLLGFCVLSPLAQADSYYCSTQGGNGYINTGDSIQKVQTTCGAPTTNVQQQTPTTAQQQNESWVYSAGMTTPPNTNGFVISPQVARTNEVVPAITFQIVNNQITSISSANHGSASQFRCPTTGQTIQIGATTDQLVKACGEPTTRDRSTQQVNVPAHVVNTWSYQVNSYSKPLILQFQDGVLVKIQP